MDPTQRIISELGGGEVFTRNFAYSYVFPVLGIPQGESRSFQQTIDLGAGFVAYEIAATARYAEGSAPTGLVERAKLIRQPQMAGYAAGELIQGDIGMLEVAVTQGAQRHWYDQPVPLDQYSGDAADPYVLTVPIWISTKTTVDVNITNRVPALTGVAAPIIDVSYSLVGAYMNERPGG